MAKTLYITEHWLSEHAALTPGGEVRLPADSRLTPAARDVLSAQGIRIRYTDDAGRMFVDAGSADDSARRQVHPLTSQAGHGEAHCLLCRQTVGKKPEAMTHLNADTLVAKNDARIVFRGRVDSAIAQAVLIQAQWQAEAAPPVLQRMLADLRGGLGNALRAETLGEPMPAIVMGEFGEAQIHALSHQPLKHLGHDHIVPAVEHGLTVARLNVLRTAVREAELAGAAAFIDRDFAVSRGDVLQALNRLSSAVYVLMLIVLIHEKPDRKS